MYKNILVPIDEAHTGDAGESLKLAKHLGGKDCKIVVMTVIEDTPGFAAAYLPADYEVAAGKSARAYLEGQLETHDTKAQMVIKNGHAAGTIIEFANEHDFDLVIIASHKPQGMDLLLGSTASRVVGKTKCAVLVTR